LLSNATCAATPCNHLVFDEETARPMAYSRIVGVNRYCVDPSLNKPHSESEPKKNGTPAAVKIRNCEDLPAKAIELGIPCAYLAR
jgi:hypothetical protein